MPFSSESPQGAPSGEGVTAEAECLTGGGIGALGAHQHQGGCYMRAWWLQHALFTDMAGSILSSQFPQSAAFKKLSVTPFLLYICFELRVMDPLSIHAFEILMSTRVHLFSAETCWIDAGRLWCHDMSRSLGGAWDIHAGAMHIPPTGFPTGSWASPWALYLLHFLYIYIFILWFLETERDSWYGLQIAAADGINS